MLDRRELGFLRYPLQPVHDLAADAGLREVIDLAADPFLARIDLVCARKHGVVELVAETLFRRRRAGGLDARPGRLAVALVYFTVGVFVVHPDRVAFANRAFAVERRGLALAVVLHPLADGAALEAVGGAGGVAGDAGDDGAGVDGDRVAAAFDVGRHAGGVGELADDGVRNGRRAVAHRGLAEVGLEADAIEAAAPGDEFTRHEWPLLPPRCRRQASISGSVAASRAWRQDAAVRHRCGRCAVGRWRVAHRRQSPPAMSHRRGLFPGRSARCR